MRFEKFTRHSYPTEAKKLCSSTKLTSQSVRGLKDCDTEQALRLARCKTLQDGLAYALVFLLLLEIGFQPVFQL